MAHTNSVILSKGIKLDKRYKQVLSYTETQMLTLMQDSTHFVWRNNTFNFNNTTGRIRIQCPYGTAVTANYIAFQNSEYSNKWFFAFIDDVYLDSPSTCEIEYTIDTFTTWFDYWDPKQCYIIRQHATSDGIGENTIPEKMEHGPYVQNEGHCTSESRFTSYAYLVVLSGPLEAITPTNNYINMGGTIMNGFVYYCPDADRVDYIVSLAVAHTNPEIEVLFVYMIPDELIPANVIQETGLMLSWNSPYNYNRKVMSRPTDLNGYTPTNKKLLCYPYQLCVMNNLAGASNELYFEDSGHVDGVTGLEDGAIYIQYFGVPSIGASVMAIPKWYKGSALNLENALVLGKYPTLGWSEDAYTNWLSQNAVNNTMAWVSTGFQIIGGAALAIGGAALSAGTGGLGAGVGGHMMLMGGGMIASGGVSAFQNATEYYKHSVEPDSFKGNVNAGDVLTSIQAMGFEYNAMCIRREYAQKLDKFFTRYGYMQNAVQYPNMLHRQNYNYIQIASDENIGYSNLHNGISVPTNAMADINAMFRNGITIWNNHANFGDYSVSNNITS